MKLKDKVVLVTGGSRGIGQGLAFALAGEGARVIVNYSHSKDEAEKTVQKINADGGQAKAIQADISKLSEIDKLFSETLKAFDRVDILINNAGVEKNAPFWEVTEEDYDRVVDTNLKASFFCAQRFVRHLRDRGAKGKIINMSSIHEDIAFPHFTSYCVSKGGVRMLTRNLAVELGALGITVNGIAPGAIKTPINASLLNNAKQLHDLEGKIPLGRLGEPDDVAKLALFLAGPDSDYVTGSTFYVDGGLSKQYEEQ